MRRANFAAFTAIALIAAVATLGASPAHSQSAMEITGGKTCIGVGCTTATATAEIRTTDNSTKLLVNEPTASTTKVLFELKMPGQPQFLMKNLTAGQTWNVKASPQGLRFAETMSPKGSMEIKASGAFLIGNAGSQVFVNPGGNMTIGGTLTENSDRAAKRDITPVDGKDVLARLAELPIATWSYKDSPRAVRHMGPMAQDFHALFGLGKDGTGIGTLDTSGVALAAIKELAASAAEKDRQIEQLEAEMAKMRQLIQQLAAQTR